MKAYETASTYLAFTSSSYVKDELDASSAFACAEEFMDVKILVKRSTQLNVYIIALSEVELIEDADLSRRSSRFEFKSRHIRYLRLSNSAWPSFHIISRCK